MSEINSIANGTFTLGQTSANDSSLLVTENDSNVSILSTQQEISHDNTLSGNGTVDSPLGVVNGYNETVLYEGAGASSFNVSENLSSFETIKMYGYAAEQGTANKHIFEFPGINSLFDLNINDFNAEGTALVNYYTRYNLNGLTLAVTTAVHMWATTGSINSWSGPGNNPILIDKVVGINRKA